MSDMAENLESLDGLGIGDITVGQNTDGRLELFARGIDNVVFHRWQKSANSDWNPEGWREFGLRVASDIGVGESIVRRSRLSSVRRRSAVRSVVWNSWP